MDHIGAGKSLKNRIDERGDSRSLSQDNKCAQEQQEYQDRPQPPLFAEPQKIPEFAKDRKFAGYTH